jgi:4-hydroxythreonine-4-phosphate dehydrogenase
VAILLTEIAGNEAQPVVVFSTLDELDRGFAQAGSQADRDAVDRASNIELVDTGLDFGGMPMAEASERGGRWALDHLEFALSAYERGEAQAVMFAPLNKSSLHLAGMHEMDELRWFEKRLGVTGVVSELNAITGLWTSRVTSHVSHRDAPAQITAEKVHAVAALLNAYLIGSGVAQPRLAICALNPHGGENGKFGTEEIDEIVPGVALAQNAGINAVGPFPADTLFLRARDGEFDGVVTMYHDQGQIAMKMIGFDGGVTVEGGLGVAVCTPAHGTAFDRVGQGSASVTSTRNAYLLARSLACTSTSLTVAVAAPAAVS